MEVEKWKKHFQLMAEGKLGSSATGKFVVDSNQRGGNSSKPIVNFVTPLAQALELAKSEIREKKKTSLHRKRKDYRPKSMPNKKKSQISVKHRSSPIVIVHKRGPPGIRRE
ncbi:hypothetical protein BOW52_10360 [Solemya elarraichensis gill symbiont]|uniref:Uncharacterized protein n=1 Tax=Solemya elarraichensis gill symbiont TaxID=1918949 RepID=A0A1T2KWH9_9GAMM|nr:hypothetical protein BOW52_10360 [Solemya elarraichensis gill symbiont]